MEYLKGYPKEPGIYKCKADGKDVVLRHAICELTGRHRWIRLNGSDIIAQEILYADKAGIDDIK